MDKKKLFHLNLQPEKSYYYFFRKYLNLKEILGSDLSNHFSSLIGTKLFLDSLHFYCNHQICCFLLFSKSWNWAQRCWKRPGILKGWLRGIKKNSLKVLKPLFFSCGFPAFCVCFMLNFPQMQNLSFFACFYILMS